MKILRYLIIMMLIPQICFATVRSFDGTGDNIIMGDVLDVTTGNVSVCIWVNMTEDADADTLIGKKNAQASSAAGYLLSQDPTGDVFTFRVSDATQQVQSSSTTDPDGVWAFACGTYTASTEATRLYVNAVQEDTDSVANIDSLSNAVAFQIGEQPNGLNDMIGLAVYGTQFSAVLTVVEIVELMWKPESIVISTPNGFWPMFGGDSPEIDLSLNANTGTVSNATTNADGPPVGFGGLLPL